MKINGKQHYLWIALDRDGEVVDVYLQARRDGAAAKCFFKRLLGTRMALTITFHQDVHYRPDMQAGMHLRGFDHAMLKQDESRVRHFHDWLVYWLDAGPEGLRNPQ